MRLGNRLGWKSLWNVDSSNFNSFFFEDIETRHFLRILLKTFGLDMNNISVSAWKNSLLVSGKVISVSDFLSKRKRETNLSQVNRKNHLASKMKGIQHLTPLVGSTQLEVLGKNESFYDFSRRLQKKELVSNSRMSSTGSKGFVTPISAQVLCNIVAYQLGLPPKLKDNNFKRNLRKGIVGLVKFIFNKRTTPYIAGVKIICSGRWQKTKSSRKQRMTYSFGKIQRQSFSKFIDYGFIATTTKYGVCGIKVWVCYKEC